ncbi:DUF4262 domain-containing protein [Flavobacterium undicola]|uniref:DUF4262 domain-containing protein n=1 Tax=Flavobacterium undicola TaxID=1932779 RepID=UPI001376872C|nr:DUF4262 domain-containing protein [Flavobacterium undicola]MBA0882751.1 DUF4262 domain-containing protein [Flavobacterium undicola]
MNEDKKEKYFKMVHKNIDENGFHTTYVMENIGFTPFGYSTGIYKNFKIPELFISGLPNGLTTELIENYTKKYKFGIIPINQKIDDLIDRFPVYFIEVKNESLTEYVLSSIKYYDNKEYKYLQLIFPGLNGHFPNEPGYDYDQKIFGSLI